MQIGCPKVNAPEQQPAPSALTPDPLAQSFVRFAMDCEVLRFGEFQTKAGRLSPYFFNAGLFDDGNKLMQLAQFYAQRILQQEKASGERADMLFGPAYKGIPLVAAVAVELARLGRNMPFAYNRKEAKDHGEGGTLVGAPLQGKVLIVDDVMSAGTAVRESIALIQKNGAQPWGVTVALDRQEKAVENGQVSSRSAVQFVRQELGLRVWVVASLADLLQCLQADAQWQAQAEQVAAYRAQYGVRDEGVPA